MNYVTSKDYEALWNLVQGGKEIICYVPYSGSYPLETDAGTAEGVNL